MALTVDPSRRSQTRDRTTALAFGTGDTEERRRKFLGDTGALDTQLDRLAGGLEFDPAREREARTGQIQAQAQESRERLARQFAISPESIQSGRSLRGFGTIEQGLGANLAGLESELSQRAGQENRANLAAVQGLVGQRQAANLQAGQAQLQGLDALTQQLNQAEQLSQSGRQLNIQDRGLTLQEGLATGQFGGQTTLGGRAQSLQEALGGSQIALGGRAQTEAELAGQAQREALDIQSALAGRAQTEAEATGAAQRTAQTAATDIAGRQQTLAETEQRQRIQLARDELFGGEGVPAQHFQTAGEFQNALAASMNKTLGQEGYNAGFDVDDNGIVDFADFLEIAEGGRNPDGSYSLPAKGQQTLAQQQLNNDAANTARALGIDEQRLKDSLANFKDSIKEEQRQFNSSFAGIQLDDSGAVVSRATMEEIQVPVTYDSLSFDEQRQVTQQRGVLQSLSEQGLRQGPVPTQEEMSKQLFGNFRTEIDTTPRPVTTQERAVINRQLAQMDAAMATNITSLLSQAQVDVNRLDNEKKLEVASLVMSTMFGPNISFGGSFSSPRTGASPLNALLGAAGQIAGAAAGAPRTS